MGILDKYNGKKSDKAIKKVENLLKAQDKCIITLSTTKGYEKFFSRMEELGLKVTVDDSMRESIFVTVEKPNAKGLYDLI